MIIIIILVAPVGAGAEVKLWSWSTLSCWGDGNKEGAYHDDEGDDD